MASNTKKNNKRQSPQWKRQVLAWITASINVVWAAVCCKSKAWSINKIKANSKINKIPTVTRPSMINSLFSLAVKMIFLELFSACNFITHAPNCFDDLFAASRFFDLIPQMTDMDHYSLSRHNTFLLPDPFKNLIS